MASGGEGSRTLDLSIANAALSQLSYAPGDSQYYGHPPEPTSSVFSSPSPWTEADTRALQKALPRWFSRFGRELPWRETSDPYRIWISEVMLQQTTVTA